MFMPRPADGDWDALVEQREEAAEDVTSLGAEDLAMWERIKAGVADELPDAEEFSTDTHRELTFEPLGMQLSMYPGEIAVTTAYWSDGDEARQTVETLRRLAGIVERITGLTAYDPQSDRAFLDGDPQDAVNTFGTVRAMLDERVAPPPEPLEPKRKWFRRR